MQKMNMIPLNHTPILKVCFKQMISSAKQWKFRPKTAKISQNDQNWSCFPSEKCCYTHANVN